MIEHFDDLVEKTISTDIKFQGRVFDALVKTVIMPDGNKSTREIVIHNGGASILPIDEENNCYLVKQFRSSIEDVLLEAPAGKLEIDEKPRDCAIRELKEELGIVSNNIIDLGYEIVSPGYDTEKIYLYGATDLIFDKQELDEGEFLNIVKIPFSKLLSMADSGEIIDGKTLLLIYRLARRLDLGR